MDIPSTQEHRESAQETARIICECVNNLLTDITAVQTQLKNDKSGNPQSQVVLQFLYHCLLAFPECYICKPITGLVDGQLNDEEIQKYNTSKDFTYWILSRLVRIISSPGCKVLHAKSTSVIVSILKLIEEKDTSFYRELILEFVGLYHDLLDLCEEYIENNEDDAMFDVHIFSARFQPTLNNVDTASLMPPKLLDIKGYENCQFVLCMLCEMFKANSTSIQQFVVTEKTKLWSMMVRTVHMSDLIILPRSFECLNQMVETFDDMHDYFMDQYTTVIAIVAEYITFNDESDDEDDMVLSTALQSSFNIFIQHVHVDFHKSFFNKIITFLYHLEDKASCEVMYLGYIDQLVSKTPEFLQKSSAEILIQYCLHRLKKRKISKGSKKSIIRILVYCKPWFNEKYEKDVEMHILQIKNAIIGSSHMKDREDILQVFYILINVALVIFKKPDIKELIEQLEIGLLTQNILSLLIMRKKIQISETMMIKIYDYLIIILKLFIHVSHVDKSLLQKFLEVASIPWLQTIDPPWFDFTATYCKQADLLTLHSLIQSKKSDLISKRSIKLMSLIGQYSSSVTWITHVFRYSLASSSEDQQCETIRKIPFFIHSLGATSHSLLNEELLSLIRSGSTRVKQQIGEILKKIVCTVANCAHLGIENGKLILKCQFDNKNQLEKNSSTKNETCNNLSDELKLLFQTIKQCSCKELKISLVQCLESLLNHLTKDELTSLSSMTIWSAIMELMKDSNYQVRYVLSDCIGLLVEEIEHVDIQQQLIDHLSEIFSKASEVTDTGVLETLALTMGSIACKAKDDLLSLMIVSLFNCFVTQNKIVASIAHNQIQEISKCKKVSCQQLFIQHKCQLCDIAVKKLLKLLEDGGDMHTVTEAFFNMAKLFEFNDVKVFLQTNATEMLPKIVQKASPQSSVILRLYAKYSQQNRREMMFYNFKYIFSYLVRTVVRETELEHCLRYLQDETDVELSSLLISECQSVFNQLILYLSVNREQVIQGFSILACNDPSYKGTTEFKTEADVAMFLHHKLLGVLAFFNSVLINSPHYEKKIALKSIISLLNMMGPKYLTPIRLKIMAILKLTLRFQDQFPELCCSAWDVFIHNIEVECLGPLLGPIVATILPLLDTCPEQVAAIFNFLAVDNKSALTSYFKDVYFIPNHRSLSKMKKIVEENYPPVKSTKDLKCQVLSVVKGISNENEDVQRFALIRLSALFEENSHLLHEMLSNEDTIDSSLLDVINAMLMCNKGRSKKIFELIGKCFGQLGAIDSGRIENVCDQKYNDVTSCHLTVEEMGFAYDLLNELCRAFLAASNTRAQDCAAFAIQEILQCYQCSNQHPESIGYQLWRKFPESIKELLQPHLRSKYVNSAVYNWSKHSIPIFGSNKGTGYKEWICNWTNYMIYTLNDETSSKVFKPCMSIIKHDLRIGLFILPYIVLNTILSNNSDLVYTEITTILNTVVQSASVSEFMSSCTQTLFTILDFLQTWKSKIASSFSISQQSTLENTNKHVSTVKLFLERIPKDLLSKSSLSCNALSRCLMYYEQYIDQQSDSHLEDHLEFLQKIYFSLDEPDGIVGVGATRKHATSLQQQIVEHESSGKLRDAVACYERSIQLEPDNIRHYKGMLDGLIGLGQLNNALMDVAGVMEKREDWQLELKPYQAEIAWRLGHWDILKSSVKDSTLQDDWSLSLGQLLISLKEKKMDAFSTTLATVRCSQTQYLLSTSFESGGYHKAYNSIIRLHMLEDIECCSKYLTTETFTNDLSKKFLDGIHNRLDLTEESFKTRESILNLRRTLLQLWPNNEMLSSEQDRGWLITTKIARKDGLFQTAYSSLLNVVEKQQTDILIEKARWFECQQDLHKALLSLQKGVTNITPNNKKHNEVYNQAKISLLKAKWMEETEYYEPEPVLTQYKDAVSKYQRWEKGHFCLAKYYEKLMNAWDEKDNNEGKKVKRNEFIKFVIKHYGISLQYGSKYIYQSLPRLLSLWLDFGLLAQQVLEGKYGGHDAKPADKTHFKDKMLKLNDDISKFSLTLPSYQFLTAFSQLVSRICHPNFSVWKILKGIICKIFASYKQQAIWSLVAVSKSSFPTRSERCREIFHEVCKQEPSFKKFIAHSLDLTDQLLDVCNRRCSKETKLYMNKDFPTLIKLLANPSFSQIMVPLQITLTVKLPSTRGANQQYNPFTENLPMISGVENVVDVLSSLQKPKKIAMRASDGKSYTLMCKPKDDLRKDNRLMEFNSLVNKLLLRDPDCRRRQLHIRTYAVIPLNEECGLLEWVPNTTGFRYILNKIYKEKGCVAKISELKQLYDTMRTASLSTKVDVFTNRVIPKYPAVFHEWFLTNFSNPKKWYTARLSYCRTSAVMCMVGYTLGLGDRHGENILFDSVSGDCVHVDFNCLFNKGETFDCPERVPFRLTHNMVKAMGPLAYEGIFRKSCEMTMQLMRNQRDSFLSVLNTFLYDPLVEWKKESRKKASGETSNDMAVKILRKVEDRLKGVINSTMIHLPLSIEGQVHQLIRDATDIENLAQMYIGWAAYM